MTDPLEERGRSAAAAVRTRTAGMEPDQGLGRVVRRGRRPRPAAVLAVVAFALVAAPAVVWLVGQGSGGVELADEAPETVPATEPPEEALETEAPEPTEDPAPDAVETPAPEDLGEGEEEPVDEAPEPLDGFGTGEVTGELPPGDSLAFLTDVRVGGHEGFDRIVLEFARGGTSPYRVAYQEPPILSAGEGAEVPIDGEAFLELRLLSASGVDFDGASGEGYELTYDGPDRVTGDTSVVTEVVRTGDFEATLSWVVGLDAEAPFSVSVLQNPLRLVVDVEAS